VSDHRHYTGLCLEESRRLFLAGPLPTAPIIVRDGEIIGAGTIEQVRMAQNRLRLIPPRTIAARLVMQPGMAFCVRMILRLAVALLVCA